jgi:carbamoyl-phosphate synthase large subunit
VRKIIKKENELGPRIDAILPTLGGQTALNCACALWDNGTLKEFGIEMIGANREVIHRAEDRQIFKDICEKIGLKLPKAKTVTLDDALGSSSKEIGLPAIIRPAFTLGGTGGGIAYNREEFRDIVTRGLAASMISRSRSTSPSSAGRSSSSKSSATRRTTASSSAASRTSTRWASTRATPSPSRRS